jgi:3-phosphoshikimate 1-carboxyvinyltransferase
VTCGCPAGSKWRGVIVASGVVAMIDEFPIFALAAACARGITQVRDAGELRHKESDRIRAICAALTALGAPVEEKADGFVITGQGGVEGGARVPSHGDHRLAMTLTVAGLAARQPVVVDGAEMMDESFPDFTNQLAALGGRLEFERGERLAAE